jgi:hypothetical protein
MQWATMLDAPGHQWFSFELIINISKQQINAQYGSLESAWSCQLLINRAWVPRFRWVNQMLINTEHVSLESLGSCQLLINTDHGSLESVGFCQLLINRAWVPRLHWVLSDAD